jgi:hypothetical protein
MDALVTKGVDLLVATIRQLGRQVTYWRATQSVQVKVNTSKTAFEVDDGYGGTRVVWTDMTFLVPAADLVIDSQQITPQRHDIIELANGRRYEVLAPAGQNEWEYADPFQKIIRIYTMAIT